jgi:hypothetical protein
MDDPQDKHFFSVEPIEEEMLGKSGNHRSPDSSELGGTECTKPFLRRDCGCTEEMAEMTAFSHRWARGRPAYRRYQSAWSSKSAMAASVRTKRGFFIGECGRGVRRSGLAADFRQRDFELRPPGGSNEFLLDIAEATVFVLADEFGRTRWAFANRWKRLVFPRIISELPGAFE